MLEGEIYVEAPSKDAVLDALDDIEVYAYDNDRMRNVETLDSDFQILPGGGGPPDYVVK